MLACAVQSAAAQSEFSGKPYAPRLAAIMNTAQQQHLKLWFAGKGNSWELAAFELRQLTDSLAQAAVLYPGIPVSNVTTMAEPLLSVAGAIESRDLRQFAASMQALTNGCNVCHVALERSFIRISVPTGGQAPANQSFAPAEQSRRK